MHATPFDILDMNKDGRLSRSDLHAAAARLGWQWRQAAFFAVFDLLTIREPINRKQFVAWMEQAAEDPLGIYGRVLRHAAHFAPTKPSNPALGTARRSTAIGSGPQQASDGQRLTDDLSVPEALERSAGGGFSKDYRQLLGTLVPLRVKTAEAGLLIIDPQRSFTRGAWMASIGSHAAIDVAPIAAAFENVSKLLKAVYGGMEVMFTRCPFPPSSYDWDERLADFLDPAQLYFIKPGNSVFFPPDNGFAEWVQSGIDRARRTLVIGGCTLNSCVRVSAIATRKRFEASRLRVIVDLSLCGARTRNYGPSRLHDGAAAVETAVRQMKDAGVQLVPRLEWQ